MYALSSQSEIIPSLIFTKAELVYALVFLMGDVSNRDNSTKIEMVELRHYLNQIKGQVSQAIRAGALDRALPVSSKQPEIASGVPSLTELRKKFPNLTDDEILEILLKVKKEQDKHRQEESSTEIPIPAFIVKEKPMDTRLSAEEKGKPVNSKENSKKFARLLGQI